MSLDFGKLNFSTSFSPTAAFPLDARSYFETLTAAEAAAATAEEVGSSNTVYYFGESLVVASRSTETEQIVTVNTYTIAPNPDYGKIDPETGETDTRKGILLSAGGGGGGISYDPNTHSLYATDNRGNLVLVHKFEDLADTSKVALTQDLTHTFVKEGMKVTAVEIVADSNEYELDFTEILPSTE